MSELRPNSNPPIRHGLLQSGGDNRIARAALEGAIRNIETARDLQVERFQSSMLEMWIEDEDIEFPEDRDGIAKLYLAEYSRRADGELHPVHGYRLEISSEAYEEIDTEDGIETGLGIALDVLRKMLERL